MRKENNLRQIDLAQKLNVKRSRVAAWEAFTFHYERFDITKNSQQHSRKSTERRAQKQLHRNLKVSRNNGKNIPGPSLYGKEILNR